MWGIDEGVEGPALYRRPVAELDKLGFAYIHVIHGGDDRLPHDIRALWRRPLILNRRGRPQDRRRRSVGIGRSGSLPPMVFANPDFVARLRTHAPMNTADPATFLWRHGTGLHRLSRVRRCRIRLRRTRHCPGSAPSRGYFVSGPRHQAPGSARTRFQRPVRICDRFARHLSCSAFQG
jgi:hypothetical protein